MRYITFIMTLVIYSWSADADSVVCSIDTINVIDTNRIDSIHNGRIAHHLNSRNSNENKPFDWFVNFTLFYKYNNGWNPDFNFQVSTEREDGDRYDAYLISHATDYYFVRDRIDEQNDLYLFESGVHYTILDIKHGYSYMWWSNTRTERHTLYHRYESDWLIAEVQYMNIIYKTEIQLILEHKWPIKNDNVFFNVNGSYINIYDRPEIWSLGYNIGYEW